MFAPDRHQVLRILLAGKPRAESTGPILDEAIKVLLAATQFFMWWSPRRSRSAPQFGYQPRSGFAQFPAKSDRDFEKTATNRFREVRAGDAAERTNRN